ncbi:protein GAMETE EXPRESSED 1 [Magnolia sinica]|uniref:protein GAMETE EXPRESSED 1 n=1 Tax=Magnolia sinica TaxID=86752 RepID=UPI00265A8841|nr:protein GAMETE EXPRESSED 1 [Magnolia sinica]
MIEEDISSVAVMRCAPCSGELGTKLVENARRKLISPNSCWQNAYMSLFAGCSEIIADKEKQSRLAWYLSDCFQKESGRPAFPACSSETPILKCLKNLDEFAHKIYLEFFLETNSICHQLQTDAFKHETERLVNELKQSAQFAEDKLGTIEEKSELLLQSSDQIQNSLTSIDHRTQQVAKTSEDVGERIHNVLEHSKAIFEHSKGIQASQAELQEGQLEMKAKMEAGMALLIESYDSLDHGIEKLRMEAVEIEREINEVGDSMTLKMQSLQSKADEIGSVAEISLDKHKELLDGQSIALEGLDFLTKFQSQALEESRATLQKLADFGHKQQEELLRRQDQIQQVHDHLIQNSQSILAAQEEFESKQATIFAALDKLFILHNAILLESRFIKTFFFYACVIFSVYMLTSAKQTSAARAHIYLSICFTFMVEFALVRLGPSDLDQQFAVHSKIFWTRSSFLLAASIQILYSIFTYRDYEVLNHQMLLTLTEKFKAMEANTGKNFLSLSMEDDIHLSSWIDSDLAESVVDYNDNDNRNIRSPEEVAENSITATSFSRRYDLRPRLHK